jgi:hypothetical protein
MDTTTDVNTMLGNVAKVFSNKAAEARTAAIAAVADIDDPLVKADRYAATQMRGEAERLKLVAAIWDSRAAVARSGNLLFSPTEVGDYEFTQAFRELIQTCREAGRLVYTRPIDATLDVAKNKG